MACALTAVAAAPSFAQASLGLDASGPAKQVAEAADSLGKAGEQLAAANATPQIDAAAEAGSRASDAAEAGSRATEVAAAEPVSRATERVAGAVEPVSGATERVAGAAEPMSGATERLARPVLDATAGAVDSVAAPAVRLAAPARPVAEAVGEVVRPVAGAVPGGVSPRPEGSRPDGLLGALGSGDPPSGRGDSSASGRPETGGPSAAGSNGFAPTDDPAGPAARVGLAGGGAELGQADSGFGSTGAPAARLGPAGDLSEVASRRPAAPAAALNGAAGPGSTSLWPAALVHPAAPLSQGPTTSTTSDPAQASPERHPAPAPSAPTGAAAAAASGAGVSGPVLALIALLLLAAPGLSLFLRAVPEFLRPAPFIVALERPG